MTNFIRRSKHQRVLVAVVGLAALVACSGTDSIQPGPEYPMTLDVFTPGNIFSPATADIAVGGTIRFRMTESPDGDGHNALFNRSVAGAPIDVPIVKDTTVSRTFTKAGTFSYFCTVHPGMNGEVVVH
jgi:plastocyanin